MVCECNGVNSAEIVMNRWMRSFGSLPLAQDDKRKGRTPQNDTTHSEDTAHA